MYFEPSVPTPYVGELGFTCARHRMRSQLCMLLPARREHKLVTPQLEGGVLTSTSSGLACGPTPFWGLGYCGK